MSPCTFQTSSTLICSLLHNITITTAGCRQNTSGTLPRKTSVSVQVSDPSMAVAVQAKPVCTSRATQTVQQATRMVPLTARQALANQCHQKRHNRNTSARAGLQQGQYNGKALGAKAQQLGRHAGVGDPASTELQNMHPNVPRPELQLQVSKRSISPEKTIKAWCINC